MNEQAVFYGTYDLDNLNNSEEALRLATDAISKNVNTLNLSRLLVSLCNHDDESVKVRGLNLLSSLSLPQLQSYLQVAEDNGVLSFGRRPKRCLTRWFEERTPLQVLTEGLTYNNHSWKLHRLIAMLHINPYTFSRDMAYVFATLAQKYDDGEGVSAELLAYEWTPSVADIVRDASCITLANSVICHKKLTDPAQLSTTTLAELYNMSITYGTNTVLDGLVNHSISTAMNMYIGSLQLTSTKCDMFIDIDYMTGKMLNQYLTVILPYMNRAEVYVTGVRLFLNNVKTLDDVFTQVLFTSSIIDYENKLTTKLLEFNKMSNAERRKPRSPVVFVVFEELLTGSKVQQYAYNINAYNDTAPAKLIVVTQSILKNTPFSKYMLVTKMHPTLQRTIDNFVAGIHMLLPDEESVEYSEEESVEESEEEIKPTVEYVSVEGSDIEVQLDDQCAHLGEINYLNEVIQEMTFSANSYCSKIEVLEDIINMKNDELDTLREKYIALANQNSDLIETIESSANEINRLTEKLRDDSEQQTLIDTVEMLTDELDRVTLEKDQFESKFEQAVLETKECHADIEHLDNIICKQREKLVQMDQLYEEQRVKMNANAVESLNANKMLERIKYLENAFMAEAKRSQEFSKELVESQSIVTDLCNENEQLDKRVDILKADLQATNNVLGTVSEMNGRLKTKYDALAAEKSAVDSEIFGLRLMIKNSNKEINNAREDYAELCSKYNTQQSEYNALLQRSKMFESEYLLMLTTQQQLNYSRATKSLRLIQNDIVSIEAKLAGASPIMRRQLENTLEKLNSLKEEVNTGSPIEYVSCLLLEKYYSADELINGFVAANKDTLACVDLTMHGVWYRYEVSHWEPVTYKTVHNMFAKFADTTDSSYLISMLMQLKERFYKTDFIFDRNLSLIGFTNGVYDLTTHSFRDGVPSDMISNVITFDYIDYANKDFNELMEFLNNKYVSKTSMYELDLYLTSMAGWLERVVTAELNEIYLMPSNLTSTVVYRLIRIIRLVFGDPLITTSIKQAFVWKLLNEYHPLFLESEQIEQQNWQECKIYEPIDNITDAYVNYEELAYIDTLNEQYTAGEAIEMIEQVDVPKRWW